MASIFIDTFIILLGVLLIRANGDNSFNDNYFSHWGSDHFSLVNQRSEVQLRLDNTSGAGFRSKLVFQSGFFSIKMKISDRPTQGIVTSFYLTSAKYGENDKPHDEFNFEFIGTTGLLQTNLYASDNGQRQQRFQLWFDPSKDFHTYEFVWNQNQIVFFVDKIPIRVFKNNKAIGVNYPYQPMRIEASIYNAPWYGKADWSKAPFIAHYQNFGITACSNQSTSICSSSQFFWNQNPYLELNPSQKQLLALYRKKYMVYDYCTKDHEKYPECSKNLLY